MPQHDLETLRKTFDDWSKALSTYRANLDAADQAKADASNAKKRQRDELAFADEDDGRQPSKKKQKVSVDKSQGVVAAVGAVAAATEEEDVGENEDDS